MSRLVQFTAFVFIALLFVPAASHAQINNRPFAFNTPGGLGMSTAAKQAIINQQINGDTPQVLLQGPHGLLDVDIGPGGVPIVRSPDGQVIPGFRGRSWKGANPLANAGVFNPYFAGVPRDDVMIVVTRTTGQVIDEWTTMVAYLRPRYR